MSRAMLENDHVRDALEYDPKIRNLRWKTSPGNGGKVGAIAGVTSYGGYRVIEFECKHYYAHRIVWFLHYGAWPIRGLDHINENKTDNRPENLRLATCAQNAWNTTAGKCGSWDKVTKSWRVRIKVLGKSIEVGRFKTQKEARAAYCAAAVKYRGEFANLNFLEPIR